jgi:hypothetical protein
MMNLSRINLSQTRYLQFMDPNDGLAIIIAMGSTQTSGSRKIWRMVMPSHENVLAARDYDRTVTADIQSGSSAEVNHQGLREIYSSINIGCFIKKPVSIEFLVRKVKEELELV